MKKLCVLILLGVFNAVNLIDAQTPVSISITFEKDTLNLISPWAFSLEVLNEADSNIFVYPLFITNGCAVEFGEIFIEIRHENDTTWEKTKIITNKLGQAFSNGPNYVTLQPYGRIEGRFFCLPPLELIKPGKIEVRSSYMIYKNIKLGRALSNPVILYINEYKDDDLLAFQYLSKLKRPDFLLYPLLSVPGTDTSGISHAEYIILNFSQSNLVAYAHLYLTSWYASKATYAATEIKSKGEMLQYLRLSKKNGFNALEKGNLMMQEKATELLKGLRRILSSFYYHNPPLDLDNEFTFTF